MAIGRIPLIENDERTAGTIVYTGDVDGGTWAYQPPSGIGQARERDLRKRVEVANSAHQELRYVQYVGEGFNMQHGWRGWWGVLRAFQEALPSVGLHVDDPAVQPVRPANPIEGPVDLVEVEPGEPEE